MEMLNEKQGIINGYLQKTANILNNQYTTGQLLSSSDGIDKLGQYLTPDANASDYNNILNNNGHGPENAIISSKNSISSPTQ
jgi:hypothetical protein